VTLKKNTPKTYSKQSFVLNFSLYKLTPVDLFNKMLEATTPRTSQEGQEGKEPQQIVGYGTSGCQRWRSDVGDGAQRWG